MFDISVTGLARRVAAGQMIAQDVHTVGIASDPKVS